MNPSSFVFYFLLAAVLCLLLTPAVKRMAMAWGLVDWPDAPRKIHDQPMPLLGGLAIYTVFIITLGVYLLWGHPNFAVVPMRFFLGIVFGGLVLMIGGFLDDKFHLPPKVLWVFPAAAAIIVIASGIGVGIMELSNPFGAPFNLNFHVLGLPASVIFVFVWMMGMMFTTKFLDGLDGLTSGIAFIAGLTLFFLSLGPKVNQPITAALALIFAGALAGYLRYGFYPAKLFLGEGGSTFLGFMLGVLSIILGGKIATALLVMGIPILDVAWVIVRRLWYGTSPFRGDRRHLHFRLLDIGLSQKQTVLLLYAISAAFGFTAVFLQSFGKLIALIILFCVMIVLAIGVVMAYKRKGG